MRKKIARNEMENNLMKIRLVVLRCIAEVWRSDNAKTPLPDAPANIAYFSNYPNPDRSGDAYPAHPTASAVKWALDNIEANGAWFNTIKNYFDSAVSSGEGFIASDMSQLVAALIEMGCLRGFVEHCNPYALNAIFGSSFGYSLPYVNFGIQIIKPTAVWDFYGNNEWVKPKTESMYISLPELPDDATDDPYRKANMLMKYYGEFPSFFGAQVYDNGIPDNAGAGVMVDVSDVSPEKYNLITLGSGLSDVSEAALLGRGNRSAGNDYDLGVNEDAFLSFSSVLNKLISVVWQNKLFKDRLDYPLRLKCQTSLLDEYSSFDSIYGFSLYLNSLEGKAKEELFAFDDAYDREIVAILKERFEYESPWVFKFRFIMADSSVFWENCDQPIKVEGVVNLTSIEVPHAPAEKETTNVSMALARYNATGPAYPFTCS